MGIIKQEEIDEAAEECGSDAYDTESFKEGVEFAESKFKEIAIEFGECCFNKYADSGLSFKDLFYEFIKENED